MILRPFFTGFLKEAVGTEICFGESETLGSLLLSKREDGLINHAVVIVNTDGTSLEPTNTPCSGCQWYRTTLPRSFLEFPFLLLPWEQDLLPATHSQHELFLYRMVDP